MNQQTHIKELQVTISITEETIENIMSALLEDEKWSIHQEDDQSIWSNKPLGIYQDEWATNLLLHGETLMLTDKRNKNSLYSMTLEDLYDGIFFSLKGGNNSLFQNVTNETADTIIQYSIFKRLLYLS
ncbi:hypothetical protein MKY09_15615 [Psychrobacillus sp. FSL K6-4046]|uniref:hypothetical protein n=1 Tax=unclassified Psychrobacillus TaxID=2636677 RepID=UPI002040954D|nr:hypothetical protein [Psychrobacillus sp. MER TA 171]MCM3359483.1 hypothetical protein [Psychrobacillus sp. MER TA 171]